MKVSILRGQRTEHAKKIRRIYGDKGGHCKYRDKVWMPSSEGCSNTVTTFPSDNLLQIERDI